MIKSRVNYLKWIKLSVAAPVSMILAGVLGMDHAMSAAVITLLTVQDTKKDTLEISLRRILAFVIMTLFSFFLFPLLGHNVVSFAVFLCIFLFICYFAGLESGITMNVVLASHYLEQTEMTLQTVGNEAGLLIIGAGMGILANLIMPENLKKIRKEQRQIDEAMKNILERMSIYLCREDKSGYTGECFEEVDRLLGMMEKEALLRIRNTFSKGDTYFVAYMQLRMKQCEVLKSIYKSIMQLTYVPAQTEALSLFMKEISISFHETNNAKKLLADLEKMHLEYRSSELPKNREEFENRAVLMQITKELGTLLRLKRDFIEALSEEEKRKYWTDGGREKDEREE